MDKLGAGDVVNECEIFPRWCKADLEIGVKALNESLRFKGQYAVVSKDNMQ